jgi:hypothetical protein
MRKGLLRALVLLAPGGDISPDGWPFASQLITEAMQASSCYSVLRQIMESLPEAEALVDETSHWFAESPVFRQWRRFVDVVKTRWAIAEELNSPNYISSRACDNLLVIRSSYLNLIADMIIVRKNPTKAISKCLFYLSDDVLLRRFMPENGLAGSPLNL